MAIDMSANVASVYSQSNLLKDDKRGLSSKQEGKLKGEAVSVDIKTANANGNDNVQYANGETSLEDIRSERVQKESELNVSFEKDSRTFDKSDVLNKEGSYIASLANVNKQSAINLL